jgi:D-alanyl-D-alanine carboxypeptidase
MLHGYLSSPATAGLIDAAGCLSWAFGAGDGVSTLDNMLSFYAQLCAPTNAIDIHLEDLTRQTGRPSATPYSHFSIGAQYGLGIERRAWAGAEVWGHPGSTSAYVSGTWVDLSHGVTITTCVTRSTTYPPPSDTEHRYPRAQLFAMALNTAYQLAADPVI